MRAVSTNESQTETEYARYEDFDLDGPAHKEADERFREELADALLKAMGLPGLERHYQRMEDATNAAIQSLSQTEHESN